METDIKERLLKGAKMIGQFAREGQKCETGGWSLVCTCPEPLGKFCKAKRLWWALVQQDSEGRDLPENDLSEACEFSLFESFRISEAGASGLLATVFTRGGGRIVVGVGAGAQISWEQLASLSQQPEGTEGVFMVLSKYAGSVVEKIDQEPSRFILNEPLAPANVETEAKPEGTQEGTPA
jgi:hypothetical protein